MLGVHKNTVRSWIKRGLPTIDKSRPVLVLGGELREFLTARRAKNKRKLLPGEIYCVSCRDGKRPAEEYAEMECRSGQIVNLVGLCPDCDSVMYRRLSLNHWKESVGALEVSIPEALKQLVNGNDPSLNSDLI